MRVRRGGAQSVLRLGVGRRRHAGQVEVADPTARVGWALQQAGDAAGRGFGGVEMAVAGLAGCDGLCVHLLQNGCGRLR